MAYEKNSSKNESVKQFSIMPRAVICANISATARVVYAALASYYWGADSVIYPAYSTLAAALGISRSTVIRAVRELVAAGVIEKKTTMREKRGGYGTNIYILRGVKNDTSRGVKNDTMNNTNNLNKTINLKNLYNARVRAREKTAAPAVHDAGELSVTSQDLQLFEIFKQAKGSNWYELLRVDKIYCLRPVGTGALFAVSNAEFNSLCDLITKNAGSCRPLNVGQHYSNEVIIKC